MPCDSHMLTQAVIVCRFSFSSHYFSLSFLSSFSFSTFQKKKEKNNHLMTFNFPVDSILNSFLSFPFPFSSHQLYTHIYIFHYFYFSYPIYLLSKYNIKSRDIRGLKFSILLKCELLWRKSYLIDKIIIHNHRQSLLF